MNSILRKQKFLVLSLVIYFSGVFLDSYFEYFHGRDAGLDAIDEQLLTSVGFAQETLYEYMHTHTPGVGVTIEEEYELGLKLQQIAERMNVKTVYSLVLDEGVIKFTVSNPEEGETSISKFKRMHLLEYAEAPQTVFAAFANREVKYDEYRDRWGAFRSVFFPFVRDDGTIYVIGADVEIDRVLANSKKGFYTALISGFCLAILIFPLMYSYIRTLRRHYREKI